MNSQLLIFLLYCMWRTRIGDQSLSWWTQSQSEIIEPHCLLGLQMQCLYVKRASFRVMKSVFFNSTLLLLSSLLHWGIIIQSTQSWNGAWEDWKLNFSQINIQGLGYRWRWLSQWNVDLISCKHVQRSSFDLLWNPILRLWRRWLRDKISPKNQLFFLLLYFLTTRSSYLLI